MATPEQDSAFHPVDRDVDARLAAQPIRPAADFAARVLGRLADAPESDTLIDGRLALRPCVASPGFTDAVMAAVVAERRRRRLVLWASPMAAAACVALAVLAVMRPVESADARLARLLSEDAELRTLATGATVAHEAQWEGDLAVLAEIGAAETLANPNDFVS